MHQDFCPTGKLLWREWALSQMTVDTQSPEYRAYTMGIGNPPVIRSMWRSVGKAISQENREHANQLKDYMDHVRTCSSCRSVLQENSISGIVILDWSKVADTI